ncbi:MAG: D-tyrosyl-tRNA(Tyr) deacylase [Lentisphaeria bacterium]|nr:D-tyrosyl-tRNA(Tyr) deacylase [Lentisphaeria bacterium]
MRALVQRVQNASVRVDGETVGAIGPGILILLGVARGDTEADARFLAGKCAGLRIFDDEDGRMNRSLLDIGGGALAVSQFTLYGDASRGRRPSYDRAAPPEMAEPLYDVFVRELQLAGVSEVATGRFRTEMQVSLVNDGPVTILVESKEKE